MPLENSVPARLSKVYSNVVSVAAVDSNRKWATWPLQCTLLGEIGSDYGSDITVAAPGVLIFSDVPGGSYDYIPKPCESSGTSLSAPFVSGVAGLMLSVNPDLTAAQLKNIIHDTASGTGNYDPEGNEIRILDAFAAVQKAKTASNVITFTFTGTVASVNQYVPGSMPYSGIAPGVPFTGGYSFHTPPSAEGYGPPNYDYSEYYFTGPSDEIRVRIADNLTVKKSHVRITVGENEYGDQYVVSHDDPNNDPLLLWLYLRDPSGTAFIDQSLPTMPPSLLAFSQRLFLIREYAPDLSIRWEVWGNLTSISALP